jgi:hypothetical protein
MMRVSAVECQWKAAHFEIDTIKAFPSQYLEGPNFVVCQDVREGYGKQIGKIKIEFLRKEELTKKIMNP